MFDLERIRSQTELAQLDFHEKLSSTNNHAIEQIKSGQLLSPCLTLTEKQTAGRGRLDRKWWSSSDSLAFSYTFSSAEIPSPLTPVVSALATATAIEALLSKQSTNGFNETSGSSEIQIKWPNDLLVNGRKLAGILTETIATTQATLVVVGIGINVNNKSIPDVAIQTREESSADPAKLKTQAPTSLQIETGHQICKTELMIELIGQLQMHFKNLNDGQTACDNTLTSINNRLAYRGDTIRITHSDGRQTSGTCNSIAQNGELMVETPTGIKRVNSGSIEPTSNSI